MRYQSLPQNVDAYQLTLSNLSTIIAWMGPAYTQHSLQGAAQRISMPLSSPQGTITAVTGDWIVRDSDGNFSRCQDGAFQKLYKATGP